MSQYGQSDPRHPVGRRFHPRPNCILRRLHRLHTRGRLKRLGRQRRGLTRGCIVQGNFWGGRVRQRSCCRRIRSRGIRLCRFCGCDSGGGIIYALRRHLREAERGQEGCGGQEHLCHLSCRRLWEGRPRPTQYPVLKDRCHWPVGHIFLGTQVWTFFLVPPVPSLKTLWYCTKRLLRGLSAVVENRRKSGPLAPKTRPGMTGGPRTANSRRGRNDIKCKHLCCYNPHPMAHHSSAKPAPIPTRGPQAPPVPP